MASRAMPCIKSPSTPSIIRTMIRHHRIIADRIDPDRVVARQQRAGLGLVVRGDIVGLRQRLGEDGAVVLIGVPGADEDADAVLRFGVEGFRRFCERFDGPGRP